MRIKNIKLSNFRNYPNLDIQINHDIVVLHGPNAVGKTNLLESIYFASLFKSFRDDNKFIFLKDAGTAEIKIFLEKQQGEGLLEIFLSQTQKDKIYASFFIDGVKKKRKEAQGFLKTVIFDPADVDMFTKAPESRRKYLNMVLGQKTPEYLDLLSNYKRAVFQKSRLLQAMKQGEEGVGLEEWNQQIMNLGTQVVLERKEFIKFLNQNISEVYTAITNFHRPVEVFYQSIPGETQEVIMENFQQALKAVAEKEAMSGICLVGPHRDDFFLKSEGLFLPPFSSRGELRSQVLALKILELEYLSEEGGDKPILLLDDVLSELDETRRTFLLKYLQNRYQTFITTTHPLEMPAQHITLTPAVVEETE